MQTIIAMAKNIGMESITEFIKTAAQLEFMHERGCPEFQGYLFSKPVPLKDFEQLS